MDITTIRLKTEPAKFEYDPEGPEVQFHEEPDGSALIVFSPEMQDALDLRLGDEMAFEIDANGKHCLVNLGARQRNELRAKVDALLAAGPEL
jgi:hypothetical protein